MGYAVIANSHEGFAAGEARATAMLVLGGECGRGRNGREHRKSARRGLHPPSALIASTSAVPNPAISNPTFQLP